MDGQTEQPDECDIPWVDTASFVQDGDNLYVTLDGEEIVLPGGNASAVLDNGEIKVHLYAEFRAGAVDVVAEHTGS